MQTIVYRIQEDPNGLWTLWTGDLAVSGGLRLGPAIRLARLLGRQSPPCFLHHGLVMKSGTQKLSKSDRDTGVRDLRASGWIRAQVLNAARAGVIRDLRHDSVRLE